MIVQSVFLPTEIPLQPPCLISRDCVKVNQVNDMVEDMESKSERVRSEEKVRTIEVTMKRMNG